MAFEKDTINMMQRKDYVPMTAREISESLKLKKGQYPALKKEINNLVRAGRVVRVKQDRYCLPDDADLISGKIIFRQSGSAFLIPDTAPGEKEKARLDIRQEDTGVAMHGDRVLARLVESRRKFYRRRKGRRGGVSLDPEPEQARVIRILERARETLTGTLQRSRMFHYVIPDEPRIIQDILVPDPKKSELDPIPKVNDKVVVKLSEWKQRHLNPEGEIIEVLGKTHSPDAEYQAILERYGLDPNFPDAVMREVENLPKRVSKNDCKGRLDMRDTLTITIDPDDAKDFDDALSLEKLPDGEMRVGVHIADVGTYVSPRTALDKEAERRGNSTYLVGTVIPMLPHALSNGICSLVEAEDRLTKSVFLTFSKKGRVRETRFANTVIRSRKRLTYHQAYALMKEDDNAKIREMPVPPAHQTGSTGRPLAELSNKEMNQLRDAVRQLWAIADKVRTRRMNKGSLDLDMPEVKIFVDEEGYADRIERIENDESHQLIEEYMLLANEAVAKALRNANIPAIYRVHDKPDPERLEELREYVAVFNIEVGDLTQRKEVTRYLNKIKNHPQSYTLRLEFLKSLKQACYRAECDGHYGLNMANYAHFTSPIRRYADLVVHRSFDRLLKDTGEPTATRGRVQRYRQSQVTSIAQQISWTEQNSTEAERDSVKIKLLEFFEREAAKDKKTAFDAVVSSVKNHGMFIELTESMAYGLVHISTLRDDLYRLNSDQTAIVGRKKGRAFRVGDKIKVIVDKVDRFKRQIDYKVA